MANKKHLPGNGSGATDKLAAWIGIGLAKLQLWLIARLSAWESRCTTAQKKLCLMLFCGLMGSYLLYVLYTAAVPASTGKSDFLLPPKPILKLSLPPPPVIPDTSSTTKDS